jgi:hypothetical protein
MAARLPPESHKWSDRSPEPLVVTIRPPNCAVYIHWLYAAMRSSNYILKVSGSIIYPPAGPHHFRYALRCLRDGDPAHCHRRTDRAPVLLASTVVLPPTLAAGNR